VLVGGRVYFLAFSLAGPDSTPYREVDQRALPMLSYGAVLMM